MQAQGRQAGHAGSPGKWGNYLDCPPFQEYIKVTIASLKTALLVAPHTIKEAPTITERVLHIRTTSGMSTCLSFSKFSSFMLAHVKSNLKTMNNDTEKQDTLDVPVVQ